MGVTDPEVLDRFRTEVKPPEPFHLFRVELTEVARVRAQAPDAVVQTGGPGGPTRTIRRGSDDAPSRRRPG